MAAKGGHIDFMFLGPPPYPAAGSATEGIGLYYMTEEAYRGKGIDLYYMTEEAYRGKGVGLYYVTEEAYRGKGVGLLVN